MRETHSFKVPTNSFKEDVPVLLVERIEGRMPHNGWVRIMEHIIEKDLDCIEVRVEGRASYNVRSCLGSAVGHCKMNDGRFYVKMESRKVYAYKVR